MMGITGVIRVGVWFIGLVNILTRCSFPSEGIQNHAREQSQGLGFRVLGSCFRAFALLPAVLTSSQMISGWNRPRTMGHMITGQQAF